MSTFLLPTVWKWTVSSTAQYGTVDYDFILSKLLTHAVTMDIHIVQYIVHNVHYSDDWSSPPSPCTSHIALKFVDHLRM